jgi:hypothetical protein
MSINNDLNTGEWTKVVATKDACVALALHLADIESEELRLRQERADAELARRLATAAPSWATVAAAAPSVSLALRLEAEDRKREEARRRQERDDEEFARSLARGGAGISINGSW